MGTDLQLPTGELFQLGYVTGDLDAAMLFYRTTQGVDSFFTFDTRTLLPNSNGPHVRVGLAYVGPIMLELIEPDPENAGIYRDALRDDRGLQLHHLGYLVDPVVHASLEQKLVCGGIEVPAANDAAGVAYIYADTREQSGLFSEFVRKCDGSAAFFKLVPRFRGFS